MIPLKYNLRSLGVRWQSAVSTVLAIAVIVWITVLTFGMVDGINHALRITGDPQDLIVLRKGADAESGSTIDPKVARDVAHLPGIARGKNGEPLSAAEFVTILLKPRRNKGGTANLIIRGVEAASRETRPNFKIVEGRDFTPGVNEAITSKALANRFENLRINEKLTVNQSAFTIVGYFEADGSAAESEVWTDLRDLTTARREAGAVSIVSLRTQNEAAKNEIIKRLETEKQFLLNAEEEPAFFEKQASASYLFVILGGVMFVFLLFGGTFAIANTMFAAVATRGREIGALRAIGFSRASVLFSFLLETLVICTIGGLLGCLAILPFHGLSSGTANWATFSELTFTFRFGLVAMAVGASMVVFMALLGGLFPSLRAAYRPITTALRMT